MRGVKRCTPTAQCDAHRDGAPAGEPCPWFCDAEGCRRKAVLEPYGDGRSFCRPHAATAKRRPGQPRSTKSSLTPPVQFRVGADERARAEAVAAARGQTVGELAKRAFLEEIK